MKVSEVIKQLEALLKEHGDLDTECTMPDGWRHSYTGPNVAYKRLLTGREHVPRFHNEFDPEERRGAKVCRI